MTKNQTRTRLALASSIVCGGLLGLTLLTASRPSAANAPSGRFVPSGILVMDTQTGLLWQPSAATGTYSTQGGAMTYCQSQTMRLPSVTELQTIIDDSQASPAIDTTFFTDGMVGYFWTSSAYVPSMADDFWVVSFSDGTSTEAASTGTTSIHVRCVK